MPRTGYSLEARFVSQDYYNILHGLPVVKSATNIEYGIYPQTVVNDSSLEEKLNLISTAESNGWYLFDNEYYAKITATPEKNTYVFHDDSPIVNGQSYWFKCEPISWNVLSNSGDDYYLLADIQLDAHCYYNSLSNRTIDAQTIYPNNYKYSDIRSWLNDDFYTQAFSLGNSYVQTTLVNNDQSTTDSDTNPYYCANTNDRVFLPSYQDYLKEEYGFDSSATMTATRACGSTDYAKARGVWLSANSGEENNSFYWTRTPYSQDSNYAWDVGPSGQMNFKVRVNGTNRGIKPAITIKISN